MQNVRIEKLTLNIGAGTDQQKLEKGMSLLKNITGIPALKTTAKKRLPAWGLRPGLPIGCKITLRKQKALELIPRLLKSKENKLTPQNFDQQGNVSFGIHEYIDIPGVNYDPAIGVMGLQVCITLEKPGYRVKRRRIKPSKIPPKHIVTKEQAIDFMKQKYNVNTGETV
jgi:large subunit ribosomal protein L5